MAFVKEKITSEEDKKMVDSFNFIDSLRNEPSDPKYWRIDRERNAFLVATGGGVEIPSSYAFVWNNNVVLFSLFDTLNRNKETGESVRTWEILKFLAPKPFAEYEKELIDMIKEAFIDTLLLPEEDKRKSKYIFKFKKQPEYVLEGDNYKTRDVLREA